ncbi:tetratricopeptide repeat protein [Micromonospora sp. M12]
MVPAGSPGHDLTEATRSWVLFYDGRCEAALEVGQAVLTRPDIGVRAASWATMGAASAAGMLGRLGLAAELAERAGRCSPPHPSGCRGTRRRSAWVSATPGTPPGSWPGSRAGRPGLPRRRGQRRAGMVAVWAGFRGIIERTRGGWTPPRRTCGKPSRWWRRTTSTTWCARTGPSWPASVPWPVTCPARGGGWPRPMRGPEPPTDSSTRGWRSIAPGWRRPRAISPPRSEPPVTPPTWPGR